jgi:putative ABC transport system substrate-binding protein
MKSGQSSMIRLAIFAMLFACATGEAQQPQKVPRIGFLAARQTPTSNIPDPTADAFRRGLRDVGYVKGKNILIEYRYLEAKPDRIPSLVDELVQLNVDVLLVLFHSGVLAAKQATKTIPIVMVTTVDPVEAGVLGQAETSPDSPDSPEI